MSFLRPINGFAGLSDAKLSQTTGFIITKVTGNPNFPTSDPSMATMQTALNEFDDSVDAALTRDTDAINIKNEKKEALIELLHLLTYYVLYTSKGNRAIAETSGLKFAKESAPTPDITKPTNLKVIITNQVGVVKMSVDTVKGGVAYMHQYTTDATLKTWNTHTCTKKQCTIEGLTPGVEYFWRVGVVGTKDQVMYSDVISRIAS